MLIIETARKIVLDILPTVKGEYSNFEQMYRWETSVKPPRRWKFSEKCTEVYNVT
jgi:hypothetical protein